MLRVNVEAAGYNAGDAVLRGIRFEGSEGELILIGGASGSGKTTLLLAISGVLSSLLGGWINGSVLIKDEDVLKSSLAVSRLLGLVLQDPEKQVLMPTPLDEVLFTLENLGFGKDEALARATELLGRFGLLSKRLDHVETLSGGEKRRLSLASAISHKPYVIMLDEPTASMDPWGIREVRRFVTELVEEGSIVLVVEHKIKYFLDIADKLILIDSGRKIAEYTKKELTSENLIKIRSMNVDVEPIHEIPRKSSGEKKVGEPVLLVEGLECWHDPEKPLLKNVSFEVRRGEVVALVGPNGSGKTTLLKTIAGFHKGYSGEIKLLNRGKKVFYISQTPDYMFLENTVEKELMLTASRTSLRVEDLIKEIPFYHERKHSSPYKLSLGQRRWLTLTIAWAYKPGIVLMDEPTAGLDLRLLNIMFNYIRKLSESGISFIISTHDPRVLLDLVDRSLIIEGGRVKEAEPYEVALMLESIAGVY
ncbi:MAG: ATP-binding cassette domain-containing protein [Desulfurococcaceae archaeon TW002]